MEKRVQAVYRDGILQPLEALSLEDRQQVTITITESVPERNDITGYFSPEEWAAATNDEVSLDDVREALSTISGSLADAVTALRQER